MLTVCGEDRKLCSCCHSLVNSTSFSPPVLFLDISCSFCRTSLRQVFVDCLLMTSPYFRFKLLAANWFSCGAPCCCEFLPLWTYWDTIPIKNHILSRHKVFQLFCVFLMLLVYFSVTPPNYTRGLWWHCVSARSACICSPFSAIRTSFTLNCQCRGRSWQTQTLFRSKEFSLA